VPFENGLLETMAHFGSGALESSLGQTETRHRLTQFLRQPMQFADGGGGRHTTLSGLTSNFVDGNHGGRHPRSHFRNLTGRFGNFVDQFGQPGRDLFDFFQRLAGLFGQPRAAEAMRAAVQRVLE